MANPVKPIEYYTIGTVEIAFPEDKVCCLNCELLTSDNLNRPKCRKTGCLIHEPRLISELCPIQFNGEIRGTRKEKTYG